MSVRLFCDMCGTELIKKTGCYELELKLIKTDRAESSASDADYRNPNVEFEGADWCGLCASQLRRLLSELNKIDKNSKFKGR